MSQAPPTRRRWFQFGLGTSFVLIMAFAFGLMVGQRAKQSALEGGWRGIGKDARFRMFVQEDQMTVRSGRNEPYTLPFTLKPASGEIEIHHELAIERGKYAVEGDTLTFIWHGPKPKTQVFERYSGAAWEIKSLTRNH